jgi:hypothetical protein
MDDYIYHESEEEIMQDDVDYQGSFMTILPWNHDFMDSSNCSSLYKDEELPSTA